MADARLPVAGFWRRYVAYAVDSLLLAVPVDVVLSPLDGWYDRWSTAMIAGSADAQAMTAHLQLLDLALGLALGQAVMALPLAACIASPWRSTPGKALFALCVVDERLERLGFGRALARELLKLPGAPGLLAIALRADHRGWHDRWSGAYVMKRWPLAARQAAAADPAPSSPGA